MAWWHWVLIVSAIVYGLFMLLFWGEWRGSTAREKAKAASAARHGWRRWQWSQDGWVRQCKICKAVQYGGDDYEGGPDASGNVEA